MQEISILEELGLTEKEAKLYLALLELGQATSSDLIKKLDYYSKTVYELLEKLMKKGLVSYVIKSNIKYFGAVNPEKFLDILKEEENDIKIKENKIKEILPKLKQLKELNKEKQEASIYYGKKGMKSVFEDTLKQKDEILVFGGGGKSKEFLEHYYDLWNRIRAKSKIKLRLLWNENLRDKQDSIKNIKFYNLKFLPREFENPAPAMIYKDKVAITVWSKEPIAILIKSKEVNKSYRNYFELLWKIAKKKKK